VKEAVVVTNKLLTTEGVPEKRHIVLQLPTGMTYKAGDYLAVLPMNNQKNIRRVLKWANLPWDAMLTIKSGANTTLPTGHPISATVRLLPHLLLVRTNLMSRMFLELMSN